MIHNLQSIIKETKRYHYKLLNAANSSFCKDHLNNMALLSDLIDDRTSNNDITFLKLCYEYQKVAYASTVLRNLSCRIGRQHLGDFYDHVQADQIKDSLKLSWDNIFTGLKGLKSNEVQLLLKKAPITIGDYTALWDAFESNNKVVFTEILNKTTNTTEFNLKLSYLFYIIDSFIFAYNIGKNQEEITALSLINITNNSFIKSNEATDTFMKELFLAYEKFEFTDDFCDELQKCTKSEQSEKIALVATNNNAEWLSNNVNKTFDVIITGALSVFLIIDDSCLSKQEKDIIEDIMDNNPYVNQVLSMLNDGNKEVTSEKEILNGEASDSNSLSVETPNHIYHETADNDNTLPLPPVALMQRSRLHNMTLINIISTYVQDSYFESANIKDIKFVFFGEGTRPEKSLKLITSKNNLSNLISYIIGSRNIDKKTWMFFGSYIKDENNRPIIPLDPNHKDWKSNHPSGWAKKREDYRKNIRNVLVSKLKRELNEEEERDLK